MRASNGQCYALTGQKRLGGLLFKVMPIRDRILEGSSPTATTPLPTISNKNKFHPFISLLTGEPVSARYFDIVISMFLVAFSALSHFCLN